MEACSTIVWRISSGWCRQNWSVSLSYLGRGAGLRAVHGLDTGILGPCQFSVARRHDGEFPKIRQVSGRAITVESPAAGLRAALATGAERLVGTPKICSVITRTWRVRLEKKGRPIRLCQWPHLRLGLLRHLLLLRCLLELP